MIAVRRALGLLLVLTSACGGGRTGGGAAPPGPAASGPPEAAVLARFEALDDAVERTRGECPRLAGSIDAWLADNREPIPALIARSRAEPGLAPGELAALEQHLERIFERVLDAVTTCRGQGGVDAAHARLDAFLETT